MPKQKKVTKRSPKWQPPQEWLQPVANRQEFKFCFALMNGAHSGKLKVAQPRPLNIEGVGEVSFTNIPINRAMLAVSKHLNDTYPDNSALHMSVMSRLMFFQDFMFECIKKRDPRLEEFVERETVGKKSINAVAQALIEAAASATVTAKGLNVDSMFEYAKQYSTENSEREA